jgi:glyoxylase-like metal-dependent hydrolase (beta-lactamase superfamily II)
MKLAEELDRIGSDLIACYLVEENEKLTLIDAGLAGHWRDLIDELASIGRSITDVRGLVLTHGDTDHIGFAERLRREHGVPVFVHEADAPRARGEIEKATDFRPMRIGPFLQFAWYGARKGGLRTTYLTEVRTVTDGQVLDLPGSPRIVSLPGHTPGSIAIHTPSVGAVFVGDALTTRNVMTGATGPRPAPFTLDANDALESLEKLEALDASWVLPGHGPPFAGSPAEAVRLVRQAARSAGDGVNPEAARTAADPSRRP